MGDLQDMEDFLMGPKQPTPPVPEPSRTHPASMPIPTQPHQPTFVPSQTQPPPAQNFAVPHAQTSAAPAFAPGQTQPPTFPLSQPQSQTFLSPQVQTPPTQLFPAGGAQQASAMLPAIQAQALPIAPQASPFATPANANLSTRQVTPAASASAPQPRPTSNDQKSNIDPKARQAKILAIIDSLRPQMQGKSRDECISILQTKFKCEQKMAAQLYDRYYTANKVPSRPVLTPRPELPSSIPTQQPAHHTTNTQAVFAPPRPASQPSAPRPINPALLARAVTQPSQPRSSVPMNPIQPILTPSPLAVQTSNITMKLENVSASLQPAVLGTQGDNAVSQRPQPLTPSLNPIDDVIPVPQNDERNIRKIGLKEFEEPLIPDSDIKKEIDEAVSRIQPLRRPPAAIAGTEKTGLNTWKLIAAEVLTARGLSVSKEFETLMDKAYRTHVQAVYDLARDCTKRRDNSSVNAVFEKAEKRIMQDSQLFFNDCVPTWAPDLAAQRARDEVQAIVKFEEELAQKKKEYVEEFTQLKEDKKVRKRSRGQEPQNWWVTDSAKEQRGEADLLDYAEHRLKLQVAEKHDLGPESMRRKRARPAESETETSVQKEPEENTIHMENVSEPVWPLPNPLPKRSWKIEASDMVHALSNPALVRHPGLAMRIQMKITTDPTYKLG